MIPVAWLLAYWLRFNLDAIPQPLFEEAISLIPLVMAIHFAVFLFFGVHRGIWRFISMPDLVRLVKSVVVGTALVAISIFFVTRLEGVPRSVFLLHGLLLLVMVITPRVFYRLLKDRHKLDLRGCPIIDEKLLTSGRRLGNVLAEFHQVVTRSLVLATQLGIGENLGSHHKAGAPYGAFLPVFNS